MWRPATDKERNLMVLLLVAFVIIVLLMWGAIGILGLAFFAVVLMKYKDRFLRYLE